MPWAWDAPELLAKFAGHSARLSASPWVYSLTSLNAEGGAMLTIHEPCPSSQRKRLTRRSFLRVGALTLGGLTLEQMLRLRAETRSPQRQKSVIMIHLSGGP